MSTGKPGVLLTRPLEASLTMRDAVAAFGYEPVLNPLLELVPTGVAIPDEDYVGIVFTSQAGVRAYPFAPAASRTPVYVVGEHTARSARVRGFENVSCGGEDVAALAGYLRARSWPAGSRLLYASGTHVSHDLRRLLGPVPSITRVSLYASRRVPLSKTTIALLYERRIAWIVLFSTRTAEALAAELQSLDSLDWASGTSLACLGASVAGPVGRFGWKSIVHASRPTLEALLACLAGEGAHG